MSEPINWCNLKKNIKHIGEVSTSRQDGKPTGAEILTSTNEVTGQRRDTLEGRLRKMDAQFQDRFATLTPIEWEAGLKVTNPLQVYKCTDSDGVERTYLPDPLQIPFTTEATFAGDAALNRWVADNLVTSTVSYQYAPSAQELMFVTSAIGCRIKTHGFHSENDGGGAEYIVVDAVTADNYTAFALSNGLVADLIVNNNSIPARQVGVNGVDDTASFIAVRDRYLVGDGIHDYSIELDLSGVTAKLVTPEFPYCMFRLKSGLTISSNKNVYFGGSAVSGVIELEPTNFVMWGLSTITDPTLEVDMMNSVSIKNIVVTDSGSKIGVGIAAVGVQFKSRFENIVFHGGFMEHCMVIAKSWFSYFGDIFVRNCSGAGITIGHHPILFDGTAETDFAVNDITFDNLNVNGFGKRDRFELGVNENQDYGIGIYGTMHGCCFNGLGGGGGKGAWFVDHLYYGSYKVTGRVYVENAEPNDADILLSTPSGHADTASAGVRATWEGINLQQRQGIYVRKNNNSYYTMEVLHGVGNNTLTVEDGVNDQNFRMTPNSIIMAGYSNVARDKIYEAKIDLSDWTQQSFVTEAKYLGYAPAMEVWFIPTETTTSTDSFTYSWESNGSAIGTTYSIQGGFTPYEPVKLRGLSVTGSTNVVTLVVGGNYTAGCEGYLVVYQISRDIK